MKIMIVDDEVIIRTGLAKVIKWEELGLTLLTPASSAEEALERLMDERPNILLTDIRMSGKTGLQLAEEAKELLPDLEVIILSGYDDFSYTQQAIRQEVSDYLLKTSRPEEIIKTVLRAKQRIEDKWTVHSQDRFKNKEARDRFFERWIITGEADSLDPGLLPLLLPRLFGTGTEEYQTKGEAGALQVWILSAGGWDESPSSESLLLFAVENTLNDLLPCETLINKKRVVVVTRTGASGEWAAALCQSAFAKVERLLKCRLCYAGGVPAKQAAALHESYTTADQAFGYRCLLGADVWDYSDVQARKGGKQIITQEEELELSSLLLDDDPVALKGWVQRFVHERLEDPQMTLESLEASLHSTALSSQRWLERVTAASGKEKAAYEAPAPLQFKPSDQPKELLFQHLYTIMKLYHQQVAEGQASHVHRAMVYVEENLGGDVGLQQVARHVHLHPSHLSEVFKKETGMTFGDFVTKKKMRRAMDILIASPAKVSEVASMVGYEDVKYFGQLFKKFTGKTPSEFREESGSPNGR